MASQFNDYKSDTDLLINELVEKMDKLKEDSEVQLNTLNERLLKLQQENAQLVERNQELIDENQRIKEERGIVYDISLSSKLQQYTFEQAKKYNLPYELMLAVMYVESSYNPNVIHWNKNGTYDSGLMQINSCNKNWLNEELGITDFLNAENNIDAGCFYFGSLFEQYRNRGEHYILMCYNAGEVGAQNIVNNGFYSTAYSRKVLTVRDNLIEYKKIDPNV